MLVLVFTYCYRAACVSGRRAFAGAPSASAKWSSRSDADEMQALAFGVPKKAKTGDALLGGAAAGAKTHGNKALAKTSTKGMKSMASFFGPKK